MRQSGCSRLIDVVVTQYPSRLQLVDVAVTRDIGRLQLIDVAANVGNEVQC